MAGSATNGVANAAASAQPYRCEDESRGALRRTSPGRRWRASTRPGRPAAAGSRAPACCRSGPCASCRARWRATGTPGSSGPSRRSLRSARSPPGSCSASHRPPSTGEATSGARSSRRRPARASTGRPPAPEVASIRTSASPAPPGARRGPSRPSRSRCGPSRRRRRTGRRSRRRRVAGLGLDDDRVGQERRAAGDLRELARELATDQMQRALAHEAARRRRPRSAVVPPLPSSDLVAVGRENSSRSPARTRPTTALHRLLAVRRAHDRRARVGQAASASGRTFDGPAAEAPVGGLEVSGDLERRRRLVSGIGPVLSRTPVWIQSIFERSSLPSRSTCGASGLLVAHALEVLLAGAVLGDPLAGEVARLDLARGSASSPRACRR